jgi:glutaconate CoA-transferase subunit A
MNPTFWEARQHLEATDRALRDKRTTLADAIALVSEGDHIAVGGCLYSRTPMALIFELLRHGRQGLTLSRSLTCYEGELLMATGMADRLVTSWMGIGAPWGTSRILRHVVEQDLVEYEEWSHLALGLRYKAGAMGVPFLPTLSMLGSDLMRFTGAMEITCPFTGKKLCAVPALFPDVALLHVHRADPFGNLQIEGYGHMDADIARAARKVVVTAEEIVHPEEIVETSDRTVIPHFVVDALVEVPLGAYPHECYGRYDAEFRHFDEYVARAREGGIDAVRNYVDEYVHRVADFDAFLDTFDVSSIVSRQRLGKELIA